MKTIFSLCILAVLLGISHCQEDVVNVTTTALNTTGTNVIPLSGDDNTTNTTTNTTVVNETTTAPDNSSTNTTVNSTNSTDNGTVVTTNTTVNSTNTTENGTVESNSTTNTTTVPTENNTDVNTTNSTENGTNTSDTSVNSLPGGVAVNVSNSSTFPNTTTNGSNGSNVTGCHENCETCSVANDNMSCTSCNGDSFLAYGQCICQGANTLRCNSQLAAFNGEQLYFLMGNFSENTINNWGNGSILTCDNDLPMLNISRLNASADTNQKITLAGALQAHEIAMISLEINVFLAPLGEINVTLSYDNQSFVKIYNSSTVADLALESCFQAGNVQYYQDNIINWTVSSNETLPNITVNVSGDGASSVGIRNLVILVANCSAACPGMCSGPGDYRCLSCPDGSNPLYGNCLCSQNASQADNTTNVTVTNSTINNTIVGQNGTVNSTNTTNVTVVTTGQCLAFNETGCPVGCEKCSWLNGAAECFSCLPNFNMVVFRNITSQWTGVCVPNNSNVNWNMVTPPLCDASCGQCFGATKYQCSSCAANSSSIFRDGSVGICGNATDVGGPTNETNTTTTTNTTVVNGTDGSNTTNTTTNTTTTGENGTNTTVETNATTNGTDGTNGTNSTVETNTTTNGTDGTNTTVETNTTATNDTSGTNTTVETNTTTVNGTSGVNDTVNSTDNNTADNGTTGDNSTNTTIINSTNTTITNGSIIDTDTNITITNTTNGTDTETNGTSVSSNSLTDANGLYYMTNLPACPANMTTSNATCDILNNNYISNLTFGHFSKYFAPLHYLYIEATSVEDLCFTCLAVDLTVTSSNGTVFPVKFDAISAPMTGAVKSIFMSNFSIDDVFGWGCNSAVAAGNLTVLWCDMQLTFLSLDQQTVMQTYNFTFISYISYAMNVLTNLSDVSNVHNVNKIPTRCVAGTCSIDMSATAGLTLCNDSDCTGTRASNIFGTAGNLIIKQSLDDLPGFSLTLNKVSVNLLLSNGSFLMDATNVTTQSQGLGQAIYTIPLQLCTNCTGNIMVLIQSHVVSYTAGRRRLNNAPKSPFEGLNRRTSFSILIEDPQQNKWQISPIFALIIGAVVSMILVGFVLLKTRKQSELLVETSSPSSIEIDPNAPIRV